MVDSTIEFVENIFDKILSNAQVDLDELNHLRTNVELKLEDIENKLLLEESKEEEILPSNLEKSGHVCDFDPLALQCFLNNVNQAIERNPGLEDYVLIDVIEFCCRNNIALPLYHEDESSIISSELHLIVDKVEEENYLLWKNICKQIRSGILILMKTGSPNFSKSSGRNFDYQIFLFDLLHVIFPFNLVFEDYCRIQVNFLKQEDLNSSHSAELSMNNSATILALEEVVSKELDIVMDNHKLLCHFTRGIQRELSLTKLLELYRNVVDLHINSFLDFFNEISYSQINFNSLKIDSNEASTFTVYDVNSFSKVFYILSNWSQKMDNLLQNISNQMEKTKNDHVMEESSQSLLLYVHTWGKLFTPYQPLLKKIIPLYIQCTFDSIFHGEGNSSMVLVNKKLFQTKSIPCKITLSCKKFLSLLNETVIFTTSESLEELNEATTSSLNEIFNIHCSLLEKKLEAESNQWKCYEVLCDCLFTIHKMIDFDFKTAGNFSKRRGTFHRSYNRYKEIQETSKQKIMQYHVKTIKSSIIFDNHGNNWADEKPFSEGERCSYTIQMWNFYMRGLIFDLKNTLSMECALEIIRYVATESLTYFALYYTAIQTSYRRVKQFQADIQVILLTYQWLLLMVSQQFKEITDMEHENSQYWHILCKQLLEILIVNCSPLSQVVDFVKNPTDALNCVRVTEKWYNQMTGNRSQNNNILVLNRLGFELVPDLNLLKLFMLNQNGNLSRLLLKHFALLYQPVHDDKTDDLSNSTDNIFPKTNCEIQLYKPVLYQDLCTNLFGILYGASKKSFLHFMACLIVKDDSKSFKISTVNKELPMWLKLVSDVLNPTLERILKPALELLFAESKFKAAPSFQFTKLQALPCGCPTMPFKESDKFLTGTKLLHKCLIETLKCLVDSYPLLPSRIWDVLIYIKTNPDFSQSWIKTPNLGTKILASLLYNWLLTKDNFKQTAFLTQTTSDKINAFAELLWHIIYNLTYDVRENPNISMDIQRKLQMTGETIQTILDKLHQYFDKETLNYNADEIDEVDFNKSHLEDETSNSESLMFVYEIVKTNYITIKQLLEDPKTKVNAPRNLVMAKRNLLSGGYNPIEQFQIVGGDVEIDHHSLLEFNLDWDRVIPQVAIPKWRSLINNRFEFKENAQSFLNEEEKEQVEIINDIFGAGKIVDTNDVGAEGTF